MKKQMRNIQQPNNQQGFTLLELLLVVLILSGVAWMALNSVENNADQVRFENTRNRLKAIRFAIIGDSTRTINGQPEIRGYVADMGKLPDNIKDLITGPTDPDLRYQFDSTYGLWSGWNGPYLASTSLTGGDEFRDGWGNVDPDLSEDDNFGWDFSRDDTGDLAIKSKGKDNQSDRPDDEPTDIYSKDYPSSGSLIYGNEYSMEVESITVDFESTPACWKCVWRGDYTEDPSDPINDEEKCRNSTSNYGGTDPDGRWVSIADVEGRDICENEPPPDDPSGYEAVWLGDDTENICMAIVYVNDGDIAVHQSEEKPYEWGKTQQVTFTFADGKKVLNQGTVAYGIFKDNGTNCECGELCKTGTSATKFQSEYPEWQTMQIVPGSTIQTIYRPIR